MLLYNIRYGSTEWTFVPHTRRERNWKLRPCGRGATTAIRRRGSCDLSFTSSHLVFTIGVCVFTHIAFNIPYGLWQFVVYIGIYTVYYSFVVTSPVVGVHFGHIYICILSTHRLPSGSSYYYRGRRLIKTASRLHSVFSANIYAHSPLPRSSYYVNNPLSYYIILL